MKERLIKNLGLKILSIFLAFIIWLIVVNVSNPLVSGRREVTLEIENDQVLTAARRAYDIMGKSTVTVTFDVHARDNYKVQPSDFRAYIDLSELYDVTGSVPVKVEVLKNDEIYYNVSSKPGIVRVQTEDMQTKPFVLEADVQGKPADGYAFGSIVLSPETVTVEGPVSQVGLINHIGVKILLDENVNGDLEGRTGIVFYDSNGNELQVDDRVHTDVEEKGVHYIVYMNKIKELSLDFDVEGEVAPGYRFTGVECSKRSVSVTGSRSGLASLNTIMIPSSLLNINNATKDRSVTVDVRELLPEGVEIGESDNPMIEIRLRVEPLVTRNFELTESDLVFKGQSQELVYKLLPSRITVTIQGLREDLEQLTKEDLKASLELEGLPEGTHTGSLQFESSDRFDVVSQTEFQIQVQNQTGAQESSVDSSETDIETTEGESISQGESTQASQAEGPGLTEPAAEAGAFDRLESQEGPGLTE
ncbi:hypothetical protein D3Z58_18315 [Clostridiaceae bacterium]|nr:hypothetical protein [Clostridiaceae bacterium]